MRKTSKNHRNSASLRGGFTFLRSRANNASGQILVVSVFIVVVLVISISLVVFINQVQGKFGVAVQKRQKASSATQQGLSYAIHILSTSLDPANPSATWMNALQGKFPAEFFDTSSPTGLHF